MVLEKLMNLGVGESHSLSEVKKIKLLNQIVLLFSAFVFVKLLLEIYVFDLTGSILSVVLLLAFMSTLFFHCYKKIILARVYFTSTFILALIILNILLGRDFGVEFGFFPIIIIIITFFETQFIRFIWLAFFLFCYSTSIAFLHYNEPLLIHNLSSSTYYFMFIICISVVFLSASFFLKENKKYEVQMRDLLKKIETKNEGLENANQELERFAYAASHDLKTPLRNINSFLNLIERKIKKGQIDEIPEYLEFASLNAQRMYRLIEDILEFSRFSNGEFPFINEDLNEIFSLAISNIGEVIKSKNARVNCEKLPMIYCNSTQMVSLFQNLIENGIKYNEEPIPRIDITCKDKGKMYEILIADNGIGIEKEYQDKVFEMFYRLHNQGEYDGSGIGLSSCKKIVTYHGGGIYLESELEKGTKFRIVLPKMSQDKSLKNVD